MKILNIMTIFSQLSYAMDTTSEEMDAARQWAVAKFETTPMPPFIKREAQIPEPPFSFIYGGQASGEFLKTWDLERTEEKIDEYRTQQTLTLMQRRALKYDVWWWYGRIIQRLNGRCISKMKVPLIPPFSSQSRQ